MPSLRENYPFAFLECLGHMPCVVLDHQDWSDNFNEKYFTKVGIKDAGKTIAELYSTEQSTEALDYVVSLDDQVVRGWVKFLNDFVGKRSNTSAAKINESETVQYAQYIKDLERSHLAREDFESVLSNRYKFINVVYTDDNTYLSKDPLFKPVEEEIGLALFEGL